MDAKDISVVDFAKTTPFNVVPVFNDVAAATPNVGVTRVGDVANTPLPVPVIVVF